MLDFKYTILFIICVIVIMVCIQTLRITLFVSNKNMSISHTISLFFSILTPPVGDTKLSLIVEPIMYYVSISSGSILHSFKNREHTLKLKVGDGDDLELTIQVVSEFLLPVIVNGIVSLTMDVTKYNKVASKVIAELKQAHKDQIYVSDLLMDVKQYSENIDADIKEVIYILTTHLQALDIKFIKTLIKVKEDS